MLSILQRLVPFFNRSHRQAGSSGARDSPALTDDENGQNLSGSWTTVSKCENLTKPQKSRIAESLAQFRFKGEFVVDQDISGGRERYKIPALSFKSQDGAPRDYHYVTEYIQTEPLYVDQSFSTMTGCECRDGDCSDGTCHCSSNHKTGRCYSSKGRLSSSYNLERPELIYECNASCKCNRRTCQNRVIQNGCQVKVVLFRTSSRGWGVRTLENLKKGTFVGVYSGELVAAQASTKRQDDTYLFNLAPSNVVYPPANQQADESATADGTQMNEHYVCDAKFYGNFTRFINHSCDANVIGIKSFTQHHDSRFPYISFFTNQDVMANNELTLNYGDNYWLVKCKRDNIFCRCRQSCCRFNKKTFPITLKQHQNEQRRKPQ